MKAAILSLGLAAGLAAAQSLAEVPKCASPCVTEYVAGDKIAGCKQFDIECVCSNDDFIDGIACCLQDACDQEGMDATVKFAKQICSTKGVEVPDKVECKSGAASNTPTPTTDDAAGETESPDAAPAAVGGMTGLFGAAAAMLFAL